MKCIIKAMGETEYRPRAKWWGYVQQGKRYLMRYHHCFAIFSNEQILKATYQTVTDKAGVQYAVKMHKEGRMPPIPAEEQTLLDIPPTKQ